MIDYINIGPVPPEEDCAQVGSADYPHRARIECQKYIELLRKHLGDEPAGARLKIKSFSHDFGSYLEVVCEYDESRSDAVDYAFKCESNGPMTWEG